MNNPADITPGSITSEYKSVRAAGMAWVGKTLKNPAAKRFDLLDAAKKLGLEMARDRTVVFDDESEMDVLTDFFLHDFRSNGKNVLESCVFEPDELSPLEAEIHQAHLRSHTSLFEAIAIHESEPQIRLRDRLNLNAPELWLTDIGVSASFRRRGPALFFTRIVSLRGLHITSGIGFVFAPQDDSMLLDRYRRAMWPVPASSQTQHRMRFFFEMNRKFGGPIAFRNPDAADEGR